MSIERFRKSIARAIEALDKDRDRDTFLLAKEARALLVRRIQRTGKDAQDRAFGNYSNNPIPAFYFSSVLSLSQQSRVKKEVKDKGGPISYKEMRELTGRQTGFVDMTFSGKMWANTIVVKDEKTSDKSSYVIKGKDPETVKKLGYNARRYGNIMALNKEEITQLAKARAERFGAILNKFLR